MRSYHTPIPRSCYLYLFTPPNPAYVITNVQAANAGSYTAAVTNAAGSATSQMAVLTVLPRDVFTFRNDSSVWLRTGQFRFRFGLPLSGPVAVEYSTNLLNWSILATLTNAPPADTEFTDPSATGSGRFYRLKWQP